MKRLNLRYLPVIFVIFFYAGSATSNTVIEYELGGGWTYEVNAPNAVVFSDNPAGGINADINTEWGQGEWEGESRHALTGFSIFDHGFIQLEYGSLASSITGSVSLDLIFELEFLDSSGNDYSIAMALNIYDGSLLFETWFEEESSFEWGYAMPVPSGVSVEEGALGLYFHDSSVTPYFKDINSDITYMQNWDLSAISDMYTPSVDNDFEADSTTGGTVNGSVNLKQVVYGPGKPASVVPLPAAVWLFGSGLIGLIGLSRRRR